MDYGFIFYIPYAKDRSDLKCRMESRVKHLKTEFVDTFIKPRLRVLAATSRAIDTEHPVGADRLAVFDSGMSRAAVAPYRPCCGFQGRHHLVLPSSEDDRFDALVHNAYRHLSVSHMIINSLHLLKRNLGLSSKYHEPAAAEAFDFTIIGLSIGAPY